MARRSRPTSRAERSGGGWLWARASLLQQRPAFRSGTFWQNIPTHFLDAKPAAFKCEAETATWPRVSITGVLANCPGVDFQGIYHAEHNRLLSIVSRWPCLRQKCVYKSGYHPGIVHNDDRTPVGSAGTSKSCIDSFPALPPVCM